MEQERGSNRQHQVNDMASPWYVMLTRHPQLLDIQLQRENVCRHLQKGEELPLLEYFIPHCFLKHLSDKMTVTDAEHQEKVRNLRQDFHDYVFIHTNRQQITQLINSEWNKSMRSRLRHFRDPSGREVTITNEEMSRLIGLFSEMRISYRFGLPVPNLGPEVKVRIRKEGHFRGQTARVIEVKHTADGISLNLGIPMFNGLKELKLTGLTLEDIQAESMPSDIIGTLFLQDKENILTDILERRIRHTETDETRRQDATMLNHTFLYSYVTIKDPLLSARFLALMLICSTLRFDRASVRVLIQNVKALLDSRLTYPSDIQALLYFSLYISTRDADYRTAGKQCIHQHPDAASPTLRRLMSLVSIMRSKRKRTSSRSKEA